MLLINLPQSPKTGQSCPRLIRACFREKRPHRLAPANMDSPHPAAPQTDGANKAAKSHSKF